MGVWLKLNRGSEIVMNIKWLNLIVTNSLIVGKQWAWVLFQNHDVGGKKLENLLTILINFHNKFYILYYMFSYLNGIEILLYDFLKVYYYGY